MVDQVVPILPERLSNNICSLRPHEDKLCYSAVFELDKNAEVLNQWFGRTVINSDRRFNYDEAQEIIETGRGDLKDEILELDRLAKILRARRIINGAVEFDRMEVKFDLDLKGKPLRVYFKENKDSNKLIEEFMLLANRRVAEIIGKKKEGKKEKTFVYRIHDLPNQEKLASFANFSWFSNGESMFCECFFFFPFISFQPTLRLARSINSSMSLLESLFSLNIHVKVSLSSLNRISLPSVELNCTIYNPACTQYFCNLSNSRISSFRSPRCFNYFLCFIIIKTPV